VALKEGDWVMVNNNYPYPEDRIIGKMFRVVSIQTGEQDFPIELEGSKYCVAWDEITIGGYCARCKTNPPEDSDYLCEKCAGRYV
jgi:hypothetical protein